MNLDERTRSAALGVIIRNLAFALLFWLTLEATKGIGAVYAHEPWQDDPYDAGVSFMLTAVPFLTGLCLLRLTLFTGPVPPRRALDVLRTLRIQAVLIAGTLLLEWSAVAVGAHRASWDVGTRLLIGLLAGLSVTTGAALVDLSRAVRRLRACPDHRTGPDWVTDLVVVGRGFSRHAGILASPLARSVDTLEALVARPLHRHPVVTAGWLAALGGLVIGVPQIVLERYGPELALLFVVINAASLFTLFVVVGFLLQAVPTSGRVRALPAAAVTACIALPGAATFRDALWAVTGVDGGAATVDTLWTTCAAAAAVGGALGLVFAAGASAVHRHR
ncbi:hypothetical protein ACIB24_19015 [Spongisporangium articulatum]|uniref:Integral membrane protein n=1 Tax=Spongisporangium articulatum TaxID=3362603 RepID=A0ABW8AS02_9ACTN